MRTLLLVLAIGCDPRPIVSPLVAVSEGADFRRTDMGTAKAKAKHANNRADEVIRRLREIPVPETPRR